MFAAASICSIVSTYFLLRWYCRQDLKGDMQEKEPRQPLSTAGKLVLSGIALVSGVLLFASAFGEDLGLPTLIAVLATTAVISWREKTRAKQILRGISWSVLPQIAALFILVDALESAGALIWTQRMLHTAATWERLSGSLTTAFAAATATNLVNNLPLGLIAGATLQATDTGGLIATSALIATDLGPNLSVTGSLATILWLIALRREGLDVSFGNSSKLEPLSCRPLWLSQF